MYHSFSQLELVYQTLAHEGICVKCASVIRSSWTSGQPSPSFCDDAMFQITDNIWKRNHKTHQIYEMWHLLWGMYTNCPLIYSDTQLFQGLLALLVDLLGF